MKIEEAMVYLLATSQHGMKAEQIARELELRGLVPRRPGRPPLRLEVPPRGGPVAAHSKEPVGADDLHQDTIAH